ncbi:MAG: acetyl-CoA carboxylase carboxyltransferase subunit beta [Bacteroidetes bacterium]|nr:MAG: acetyl-CoA carboxylase carboxyltransferase subunit beta [Bacteroidota bacterium]
MSWYNRIAKGITTRTREKKETKEGLWHKCTSCKKIRPADEHVKNLHVCLDCGYHDRIGSKEYFEILFDNNEFLELNAELASADPLNFSDTKKYADRLVDSQKKTGLKDALASAAGKVNGNDIVVCCMDFTFIGGSMGAVVGEKISLAIDFCLEHKAPLMIISKSGGARMQEAAFSLMQLAKTSAKLTLLHEAGIPYISFLTDPTTGGITASFAMLGDLNIAEPGALIGFAGPRVIKETIKKDLPKGFQTSEFLLEHGFLDMIVPRKELKAKMAQLLTYFKN